MHFHIDRDRRSWGRVGSRVHRVARPRFVEDVREWNRSQSDSRLAVGSLRSYSDVCLSDGSQLIDMTGVNRFRSFDAETGILVAEAGATIDALLKTFVPHGWFVPVTPGTRFVTLGGAVANDVHGKNHHRAGTFGQHVSSLTLERSGEGSVTIGPEFKSDLFSATVGGLGLTGIISEIELRLQRIPSSQLQVETLACPNLEALCSELEATDAGFEHSVAWIDCTASSSKLGRGIITRANWSEDGSLEPHGDPRGAVPTDRLDGLLNPLSLRAFNSLYHLNGTLQAGTRLMHYDPFLYPLDSIRHWNRLYGRKGFYQYQCVIPDVAGREPVRELLETNAPSGVG
jgi:FAD/FMN-containing dehydrogenase